MKVKTQSKEDKKEYSKIKRFKHNKELVILPRDSLMRWYKSTEDQFIKSEKIRATKGYKPMECPNCKNTMKDYHPESPYKDGFWYICVKCGLCFSQEQHDRLKNIILNIIPD